jgi:hypothetical protein
MLLSIMGQLLKQRLSREELLQLLNWELAAYEQCEGRHFSAIDPEPDEHWSAHLEDDGSVDFDEYALAWHVVEQTRQAFDLRQ